MLFVVKYLVEFIVVVFSTGFIVVLVEATINVYIAPHKEVWACTLRNHRFALFTIAMYGSDCVLT